MVDEQKAKIVAEVLGGNIPWCSDCETHHFHTKYTVYAFIAEEEVRGLTVGVLYNSLSGKHQHLNVIIPKGATISVNIEYTGYEKNK